MTLSFSVLSNLQDGAVITEVRQAAVETGVEEGGVRSAWFQACCGVYCLTSLPRRKWIDETGAIENGLD